MSTVYSNEELAVRIQNGETYLYGDLWEQTKRLFFRTANTYFKFYKTQCTASGVTLDDLQQMSFLALCDSVRAYAPEKDLALTTYFRLHMKNRFAELVGYRTKRRDPLNECNSLDDPLDDDDADSAAVVDTVPDDAAAQAFLDAEDRTFQKELHDALEHAMRKSLDHSQQSIFDEIYYDGRTISEVARAHGLPESKVRTEHLKGLRKLLIQNPRLKEYAEHFITVHAYDWTGLQSFRSNQGSSQEIIVDRLDRITGSK